MGNEPAKSVRFQGQVSTMSETTGLIPQPGDYVIVFRGYARWVVLRCPSGCGEEVLINIDRRTGAAWRLYTEKRGMSLYPSVIRDTGCHSHFVIWDNRIFWYGSDDTDIPWAWGKLVSDDQRSLIREIVTASQPIHYTEIADKLNEVPWDVLTACRVLRREGVLTEGTGQKRGLFSISKRYAGKQ